MANLKIDDYVFFQINENSKGKNTPVISTVLFSGEGDTPFHEKEVTFDSLLNEFIESSSIPTKPEHTLKAKYHDDIMAGLEALEKSIKKAKARVKKMPWVKTYK